MPLQTTRVLGFDPASVRNLGWSLITFHEDTNGFQGLECIAGTIVLPKVHDPWEAMWPLFISVDTLMSARKANLVVIEKTSSFVGGFVTGQVSNCTGVILACCGKHNVPVAFVYPTHVKKVVTGHGKATKTQLKKQVIDQLSKLGTDIKFDSEHACDAAANILCWLMEHKALKKNEDYNG